MKKLLLFILLLIPTFILAEEKYQILSNEMYFSSPTDWYDNGSSYIFRTREETIKIDKKDGQMYTLEIGGRESQWGNYNMNTGSLTSEESTNYIFIKYNSTTDNCDIILTDEKFNLVKTKSLNTVPTDFYYVNDYFYGIGWEDTEKIYVFSKEIDYIKTLSLPDNSYYLDKITGEFIPNDIDDNVIYYVDDNQELVSKEVDTRIVYNDSQLIKKDYNNPSNNKIVTLQNLDEYDDECETPILYKGKYYVHYLTTDGKNIIASYDENLNIIKQIDISTLGYDINESWLFTIDNQLVLQMIVRIENMWGKRIFYSIDENLELTPSTSMKTFKVSVILEEDANEYLPDNKSIIIYNNVYETLAANNENVYIDDVEKINEKYYLTAITENDDEFNTYLYIYNNNGTLNKKQLIKSHEDNNDTIATILRVDNKILIFYYNNNTLDVYMTDENATEINKVESIFPDKAIPSLTIHSENDSFLIASSDGGLFKSILSNQPIANGIERSLYLELVKNTIDSSINSLNGSVTIPDQIYFGDTVELQVQPNNGYKIKNIIIKDSNGNIIPVVDNKFTMPNSKITIDVEYEKEEIENPYTIDKILIVLFISIISLLSYLYYQNKKTYLK